MNPHRLAGPWWQDKGVVISTRAAHNAPSCSQEPVGPPASVNRVRQAIHPLWAAAMSEADFQASLEARCTMLGLPWMHIVNARGQAAEGFPDLLIADWRHGVAYAWELKSARGRVRRAQTEWLTALAECTRLESGLFRPADLPRLEALLDEGRE